MKLESCVYSQLLKIMSQGNKTPGYKVGRILNILQWYEMETHTAMKQSRPESIRFKLTILVPLLALLLALSHQYQLMRRIPRSKFAPKYNDVPKVKGDDNAALQLFQHKKCQ